ncbi:hypothetical protein ASG81_28615 [Paenibacillus sp. Soil522]|nr:hypothetical protein ASG81_28615 [Paenibacillus sp. Soil522]
MHNRVNSVESHADKHPYEQRLSSMINRCFVYITKSIRYCQLYTLVSAVPVELEGEVYERLLPLSQTTLPLLSFLMNLNSKVVPFGTLTGRNHTG